MPTVPAKQIGSTEPVENIEEKFRQMASVWRAETAYVSSSSDLVSHPAFQEIVRMGSPIIPLLLRELEDRTGHWHRALRQITGADPVPPADRGNLDKEAEQSPSGCWISKLGPSEDIEHQLHDLTGMVYGSVELVMKRPARSPAEPRNEKTELT